MSQNDTLFILPLMKVETTILSLSHTITPSQSRYLSLRYIHDCFPIKSHSLLSQYIIVTTKTCSNNSPNSFLNQTTPQLPMLASMYSISIVLKATNFYFLLIHDIIVDPKLKKHLDVLLFFSSPIIRVSMQNHISGSISHNISS